MKMIKQPTIPPMPKRPTFDARDTQYNLPIGTDCISRQAAIDALKRAKRNIHHNIERAIGDAICEILDEVENGIKQLPPIQPVSCSEFPNNSDTISRQQAIETFKDCAVNGVGIDGIVDALEQLPPIQPEIVLCKDCKYAEYIDDVQTLWCTECGQGRTVAPDDYCSYAERREVTE